MEPLTLTIRRRSQHLPPSEFNPSCLFTLYPHSKSRPRMGRKCAFLYGHPFALAFPQDDGQSRSHSQRALAKSDTGFAGIWVAMGRLKFQP